MIQQSELIILVLAAALVPLMVRVLRTIELPGKRWLTVALVATLVAYVATVFETFAAPGLFNLVEHASFATAGVSFAVVAAALLRFGNTPEAEK